MGDFPVSLACGWRSSRFPTGRGGAVDTCDERSWFAPRHCRAKLQDEVFGLAYLIGYRAAHTHPKTVCHFEVPLSRLMPKSHFGGERRTVDLPQAKEQKAEPPELLDRTHQCIGLRTARCITRGP
jgi:hypothetical protein